jgi:hypothetical protein
VKADAETDRSALRVRLVNERRLRRLDGIQGEAGNPVGMVLLRRVQVSDSHVSVT